MAIYELDMQLGYLFHFMFGFQKFLSIKFYLQLYKILPLILKSNIKSTFKEVYLLSLSFPPYIYSHLKKSCSSSLPFKKYKQIYICNFITHPFMDK